ncbi:composite domain of metallo-dependent hydrolase [Atractiella rhizophila]|nr:composite domain of metallo-dependent hydrolase [Atractiella rhizophila]
MKLKGTLLDWPQAQPDKAAKRRHLRRLAYGGIIVLAAFAANVFHLHSFASLKGSGRTVNASPEDIDKCASLKLVPGAPDDFAEGRVRNERFVEGTEDVYIFNATVWTGTGSTLRNTSVHLSQGVIRSVNPSVTPSDAVSLDANGAFITPALFDLHNHFGVYSQPESDGTTDGNSMVGPIRHFLRSLDGFNTHDAARHRIVAGGIGTSLVLPGSANTMGGQAFVFKMRKTKENTPTSMLLEPPWTLPNVTREEKYIKSGRTPWRHLKMAQGENPTRIYQLTRMDTNWNIRRVEFQKAKELKDKQDDFCARLESGTQKEMEHFPEDLEYDAIADLLRFLVGGVKLNIHCYETTDFDSMIRHSNEFKFPIAAFHHAHEAWLVPDRLRETYGGTPAVAIFFAFYRWKREAYRGTEYASIILNNKNISVVHHSDHSDLLDARYMLYEAAQAHHVGLSAEVALKSVTTTPAEAAGMGHRLGKIKPGYDADIVLWDSHPLSLGASPKQVWIDGIAQIEHSFPTRAETEPMSASAPNSASYEVPTDPLSGPTLSSTTQEVLLYNISSIFRRMPDGRLLEELYNGSQDSHHQFGLIIRDGRVSFAGVMDVLQVDESLQRIDLKGGSILPSATSFGPPMGLTEIELEASTNDGFIYDPLFSSSRASPLTETLVYESPVKAKDGISFGGKDMLTAVSEGVTKSITAPMGKGFFSGISTYFRLGAQHGLEVTAFIQDEVALHVSITNAGPSISTLIGALRELLLSGTSPYFNKAARGEMPLVVTVEKADHMVSLLRLKKEVEEVTGNKMKMIFSGGTEAHLIVDGLVEADVPVVVLAPRCGPNEWNRRRCLDGPPLTETSLPVYLTLNNVTVAFGTKGANCFVRHRWNEAGWAYKTSAGRISKAQAVAWAAGNLENMLGLEIKDTLEVGELADFVAFEVSVRI